MSLEKHLANHQTALKEFNNMISSKPSQLRNERTKKVHAYFHSTILPLIDVLDSRDYRTVVKNLSKVYRDNKIDIDDAFSHINNSLKEMNVSQKPTVSIPEDTNTEQREVNHIAPTHKVAEAKGRGKKKVKVVEEHKHQNTIEDTDELVSIIAQAIRKAMVENDHTDTETSDAVDATDEE
jgi:hypothetical protein